MIWGFLLSMLINFRINVREISVLCIISIFSIYFIGNFSIFQNWKLFNNVFAESMFHCNGNIESVNYGPSQRDTINNKNYG